VRALGRRPELLRARAAASTEVVYADVFEPASLETALAGCAAAYYLVHSMGDAGDFQVRERAAARNFAAAARAARLERIVYLGGLGRESALSAHLESRHEVGRILRESGVATVELRASIIIGSGSLSFEMIRALVERLPVMITPRWVRQQAQPIAIEDVVAYLIESLAVPLRGSQVFEIGGPDRASYSDIMLEYARQRGLKRVIIAVPVLTPYLSSLWLGLVTPVYARVGRKLMSSLRHATVVEDDAATRAFRVRPRGLSEAIARALHNEDRAFAETHWADAVSSAGSPGRRGGARLGRRLVDARSHEVGCAPGQAFAPIRRIGAATGWYYGNWLWALRGLVDLVAGGAGLRRGRRHPDELRVGDRLDFWRVEALEPERLLRLQAEMRVPGRAWLQFEVEPAGHGSRITQTAIFDPLGLAGLLYWYALYPAHALVFSGMLRGIAAAAERGRGDGPQPTVDRIRR